MRNRKAGPRDGAPKREKQFHQARSNQAPGPASKSDQQAQGNGQSQFELTRHPIRELECDARGQQEPLFTPLFLSRAPLLTTEPQGDGEPVRGSAARFGTIAVTPITHVGLESR